MWESAEEFKALLVFAEHRYYGKSLLYDDGTPGCLSFLTTEQAMADFAYLIDHLRENMGATNSAVLGFGGSYGGMIAAWFRMHYPNAVDGVIAASAPIWSFSGLHPAYDFNGFNKAVTWDASLSGGATDNCKDKLKQAWPRIIAAGSTDDGKKMLQSTFRTCSTIRGPEDAIAIVNWAQSPWATLAMGNYPYASSYLMHGESLLPPWPLRAACLPMNSDLSEDADLFNAVRTAAATFYNNTGLVDCFNITGQPPSANATYTKLAPQVTNPWSLSRQKGMLSPISVSVPLGQKFSEDAQQITQCSGSWGYQWCTEMVQPFTQGTPEDMFYCPPKVNCSAWDFDGASKSCINDWGVAPRAEWARVVLGGKRLTGASNIVFSNGQQDPWHPGGILVNISDTVVAVLIKNGAHHIDLMFSDPADADYPDIQAARDFERREMHRWTAEHAAKLLAV